MKRETVRSVRNVLFAVILFGLVSAAYGATLNAANNGVDGPTCGTSASPCRSITQTIANAAAGDTIQVRPGLYGDINHNGVVDPGDETPGLGAMLPVFKPLIILSTDGAAATILDARTVAANSNVLLVTGNAEFGRPDHGFTVTPTNTLVPFGIAAQGTNLKVRGNLVVGSGVGTGIDADNNPSDVILIELNQVIGWSQGILVESAGKTVSKNQVSLNDSGILAFGVGGTVKVTGNVASGNSTGIGLTGGTSAIGNAVYANGDGLIAFSGGVPFTGVIQKNNILGNWSCGLNNFGLHGVVATNNYWGAATGPGADPADDICETSGGTTTWIPFASKPFAINPSFEP